MQRSWLVFSIKVKQKLEKKHCIHVRCDNAMPWRRLRPHLTSHCRDPPRRPPATTHIETPLRSKESPVTRENRGQYARRRSKYQLCISDLCDSSEHRPELRHSKQLHTGRGHIVAGSHFWLTYLLERYHLQFPRPFGIWIDA